MQTDEWEAIYSAVGASMALAWSAPTDEDFAVQMTRLCRTLWSELRKEPWPDDVLPLTRHMTGVPQNDPQEFVRRLLSFEIEKQRMN
ncbi:MULTISPECIES: hypothetical protein [unclassified Ruegeria]|uniref:hypothetical protein n=1 Tax=unclassified Ruegeria TaxID=2625375 RepID=UPI001490AA9E|nr:MULTISPECIES: hypothetical protein [unclassified Ruegeria]NOD87892.1 hypothetical protein [Ruegeria sp. HKCCD4318]NOE14262.1 hypothetical protein [Ruegeria sp. HKCCD4318-2]NOG08381.1 hypothetical protein [Ruegeria sp. HKCCD4315]